LRFLADMGVSQSVVDWLRSEGYDAVHLREEGLQKLPDRDIFLKGDREDRVVITFDLGFGEIVASSLQNVSVIVFRLRNARAAHQVERLRAVLNAVTEDILFGAVIVIEEGRHRVRRLPIGEI
jgi:predicted nuclease of predicted toxin-antitoxin system